MAQAIRELSKRRDPLERLGTNGRKYVCTHYDRTTLTGRYRQLFHQLASERK